MKACFITGAASGIGLATAKRFAAEGYFVGLSDADEDALAKAAAEFDPDTAVAIRLDVRNEAAWGLALAAGCGAGAAALSASPASRVGKKIFIGWEFKVNSWKAAPGQTKAR